MPYAKFHEDWLDYPDLSTPVTAAALEHIEEGISDATVLADGVQDAILDTIVNAKGDLIAATGVDAVARLAVGANDKALFADSAETAGLEWRFPPGYEYAMSSITASANVSVSAESAASALITNAAVVYDGVTGIFIEFFSPRVTLPNVASIAIVFSLWDGSTQVNRLGVLLRDGGGSGNPDVPIHLRHRLTPSAASHTYSVRAHVSAAGTATVAAGVGTGGAGVNIPAFLRQVQA